MRNELNGSARPVAAALGWHVHYMTDGRVRVQLACNREAAIDIARALFSENRNVLRLLKYDGSASVSQDQIKHLVTQRSRSGFEAKPR
jgi:hypothetical protein